MKNKIIDLLKNKKLINYAIIFIVALFTCIPLFSKNMNISNDDGIQHICRLIGTYSSLKEGKLFPVIISGFCNGFGYSWNIFYSPLTAYIPLIFKMFTPSFVMCLKLFMFLTMFLSGLFMYKFVYKISNNYKASIFSAIIYVISPYHLTDMYTRIAVAELASFVFLPIVFLGMYNLIHNERNSYYLSIGAVGLILTHNVISVYTTIFCFVYLLINYKNIKLKQIGYILLNMILILLCTSFYWVPLIEHYLATSYEVFVQGRMYSNSTIIGSKLSILDLFANKPWGLNFHIGLPIILGIILFTIYFRKNKEEYKKDTIIFLIFGIISIIMTLKIFPFEYLPNIFKMLQFTWRMNEFACFFLSIVSGIAISIFIKEDNKKLYFTSIFIIMSWLILMLNTEVYVDEQFDEGEYLSPIPVTKNTRRVHAGCATFEYLPTNAFKNRKYIEQRTDEVIVLEGRAKISEKNKNNKNLSFKIEDAKENTKLELPYIYYLGYSAVLEKEDGTTQNIIIEESNNGFCMISINSTEGKILISYTGTTLMKISYILTIIGIFTLIYISCKKPRNMIQ